jgi:hypothetical protein
MAGQLYFCTAFRIKVLIDHKLSIIVCSGCNLKFKKTLQAEGLVSDTTCRSRSCHAPATSPDDASAKESSSAEVMSRA